LPNENKNAIGKMRTKKKTRIEQIDFEAKKISILFDRLFWERNEIEKEDRDHLGQA
jgi:hypothetical protein